jgi:hypothetical protein
VWGSLNCSTRWPYSHRVGRLGGVATVGLVTVVSLSAAVPALRGERSTRSVYQAACKHALVATTPGTVANPAVRELSGIAASRRNPGVWWVHNDSGSSPRVFAVGDDGRDLGEFTLSGATATDWEDIAVGPGPRHGGDIGDNNANRASVAVYRVPEPAVYARATTPPAPQSLTDDKLTFTYPDGAHDAEALMIDPSSGELFVITKSLDGAAHVYRAPPNLAAGSTTALTDVATLSLGPLQPVTAADISPAGDVIAIRTYLSVLLYRRKRGVAVGRALITKRCNGATAPEVQGEAIGFTADGRGYVTAAEGASPALHRFAAAR